MVCTVAGDRLESAKESHFEAAQSIRREDGLIIFGQLHIENRSFRIDPGPAT